LWHIWIRSVLQDVAFFGLLLEVDREALKQAQEGGCLQCEGRLDRGDYRRKPRGEPPGLSAEFAVRFSLCCSRDGCRRRLTPESVRFLARRIYVGAAVVLVAAAMQGPSPARVKRLSELFGMAPRTARRWLAWWQETFGQSKFFKSLRGLLRGLVKEDELPLALLEAVHRGQPLETALKLLNLLRPITSATAEGAQPV